jgi:hypothetical protein
MENVWSREFYSCQLPKVTAHVYQECDLGTTPRCTLSLCGLELARAPSSETFCAHLQPILLLVLVPPLASMPVDPHHLWHAPPVPWLAYLHSLRGSMLEPLNWEPCLIARQLDSPHLIT